MAGEALVAVSPGGRSMERLREKLKELRRRKGWFQEDLAREIDVSLSTIQRWEARGGKPYRLARRELGYFAHSRPKT